MEIKNKVLILIPSRYASSRFPGKPMAYIGEKSMIQRVYENCKTSEFKVCVVTDDQKIESHVKAFNGLVCRVDDDVTSGTERIQLAYQRYFSNENHDLVINVQGDEPLLSGAELKRLAEFHLRSKYEITTIIKKVEGFGPDYEDSNKVKVIFTEDTGKCHYFSRATIPYRRDKNHSDEKWFHHIGVYSYTTEALREFCQTKPKYYEHIEKLEQLRALEIGMNIGAIVTEENLIGVDIPEDIQKIEGVLSGQESK